MHRSVVAARVTAAEWHTGGGDEGDGGEGDGGGGDGAGDGGEGDGGSGTPAAAVCRCLATRQAHLWRRTAP